jgi:hypothetical protein
MSTDADANTSYTKIFVLSRTRLRIIYMLLGKYILTVNYVIL